MLELEAIHFGTCCVPVDASLFVHFIALFGNAPSWLFVANLALGVFNRDIYFLIASNFNFLVLANALRLLSTAFAVPHPEGFDYKLCDATHYAFPDAIYVTTISYVLCSSAAFVVDTRLSHYANALPISVFVFIVFFYCASTLFSHYFDAFLFVCNTLLAFSISALFTFAYAVFAQDFLHLASRETRRKAAVVGVFLEKEGEAFIRNLPK